MTLLQKWDLLLRRYGASHSAKVLFFEQEVVEAVSSPPLRLVLLVAVKELGLEM